MKKVLALLMSCSLLLIGCKADDFNNETFQDQTTETLQGKTITLNQQQLFSRYENNKVVKDVLNSGFNKNQEGKTIFNESDKNPYGVYIDLDHIQVFESEEIHAITYKVDIEGISTESEDGKVKEIFNLVYFSTNKVDYYVTLFRYDFSTIPLEHFIQNPQETHNLLTFVPLKDIENIYENIHSSIFNGLAAKGGAFTSYTFQSSDCTVTTYVAGTPCKGDGYPKHNYGEKCGMTDPNDRATPGFSYTTYKPCGGGSSGGGGGSVGNPGGGGGGGSTVPVSPIKLPGDFVKYPGGYFAQIDLGNTDNNSKILKSLVENNKVALKDLYENRNKPREYGYRFSKTKTADLIKVVAPGALPLATLYSLNTEILRKNSSIIGYVHTHGNTSVIDGDRVFPMFTHSDIMGLFDMVNKNLSIDKKPSDLFAGLIVNAGFYVIMFPNDVTLDNVATKYSNFATMNGTKMTANREAQVWTDMQARLRDLYGQIAKNGTNPDMQYEKALLLTLKEFNLNVKVYKMPDDNGQFNAKWRELRLPANSQKMSDNTQPIETIIN